MGALNQCMPDLYPLGWGSNQADKTNVQSGHGLVHPCLPSRLSFHVPHPDLTPYLMSTASTPVAFAMPVWTLPQQCHCQTVAHPCHRSPDAQALWLLLMLGWQWRGYNGAICGVAGPAAVW